MSDTANRIVQKLWSYCHVLRDDGLSYQDYLEQLTFLLFLKMADERERLTGETQPIPAGHRWENLASSAMEGAELERHYRETLRVLGAHGGMLGLIFEKAQNRIQDPAKLRRLIVELIGREDWSAMAADVKGDAYEGLLEKNAQDVKGGAGQYFTPRAVIQAIVDCVQPRPGEVVVDPACGTGGFLLATHEYLKRNADLDRDQKRHLRFEALRGVELVPNVARLCGMNLYLHSIGPDGGDRREPPIATDDALRGHARRVGGRRHHQSAVRQEVVDHGREREGSERPSVANLQPPGLLDHHLEQAAQLRAACSSRCSRSTAGRPSSCPTTSCSRAAPARRCGGTCCASARCTPCCACPRAFSTRKA